MSDEFRSSLTEEEQVSYDDLLSQGYTIESIKVYLEKYEDDFNEAWDALEKPESTETTEEEVIEEMEDEKEYDAYGIPYDDVLNPKREEDQVYDKNGKLKGEDDTDYEKMLKGESAEETPEGFDSEYPEMVEEEERKNSGVDYPSEDMKSLPEKREPVESLVTEEEKKFLEGEYPEMKDLPEDEK